MEIEAVYHSSMRDSIRSLLTVQEYLVYPPKLLTYSFIEVGKFHFVWSRSVISHFSSSCQPKNSHMFSDYLLYQSGIQYILLSEMISVVVCLGFMHTPCVQIVGYLVVHEPHMSSDPSWTFLCPGFCQYFLDYHCHPNPVMLEILSHLR